MAEGISINVSSSQVRFVNRALAQVDVEVQRAARFEIQAIGELVAGQAEGLALIEIPNMPRSPGWADMRVGQNNDLVYVVPARRGVRKGPRKRPNLAVKLLNEAMLPAKRKNEKEIVKRFEALTAKVAAEFNK